MKCFAHFLSIVLALLMSFILLLIGLLLILPSLFIFYFFIFFWVVFFSYSYFVLVLKSSLGKKTWLGGSKVAYDNSYFQTCKLFLQ
jgi:hypothetical protein